MSAPTFHDFDHLLRLLACHATPGDEDEVRELLRWTWQRHGWRVTSHGHYAISARPGALDPARPTLLVTAHMDSPGYSVERQDGDTLHLIHLGGPRFGAAHAELTLKTRGGRHPILATVHGEGRDRTYTATFDGPVQPGDRACHRHGARRVCDTEILSPFLDNRLGCFLLTELLQRLGSPTACPVNVVLAATTSEEMGGYGAAVLARQIAADLVVCLDATYAEPEQQVRLGGGPVLTLSDASVLLGCRVRDRLQDWFARHELPLQQEVYNFSGTDARAFPHQGVPAPVLALLVATTGNHGPVERAHLQDLASTVDALVQLALDRPDLVSDLVSCP